jgi:mannose-6-phosphate isomerase-like protein (cupin superfamily)
MVHSDANPAAAPAPAQRAAEPAYEIVRYSDIAGTPCPCGSAKRGLLDSPLVPYSLHLTTIAATARVHYHRRITETYLILECDEGSYLELNGQRVAVAPEMAIVIPPGTRHRAVGNIKVAIVAWPKFDPADEWFDE